MSEDKDNFFYLETAPKLGDPVLGTCDICRASFVGLWRIKLVSGRTVFPCKECIEAAPTSQEAAIKRSRDAAESALAEARANLSRAKENLSGLQAAVARHGASEKLAVQWRTEYEHAVSRFAKEVEVWGAGLDGLQKLVSSAP